MAKSLAWVVACLGLGCAVASPIHPAEGTRSRFWYFGWGKPVKVVSEVPPGEQFRISHRGATGFTPVSAVRRSANARADEFCERRGQQVTPVTEQISSNPHILGNFPRYEMVFVCTDKPAKAAPEEPPEDPYDRLRRLKELLDAGAITQGEFDHEKQELLDR